MRINTHFMVAATWAALAFGSSGVSVLAQSDVVFHREPDRLEIAIGGKPFGTYVWNDPQILRPHFRHLHAPNGELVTRNSPPIEGQDAIDHATMHPGLWLAFGDISGQDFWRNKGQVRQVEFITQPAAQGKAGQFIVRNEYVANDKSICREVCRIEIKAEPAGYLIDWKSEFSGDTDFSFGDQEEMGLGIRLATPLTVKKGGEILNSNGQRNEKEVWGKAADWCDYHGSKDGQPGILVMTAPTNFRRCWFHARDYGLLVANPFGQNAFKQGDKSQITVKKGETFQLRFGVLIHSDRSDLNTAYKAWSTSNP